MARHDITLIAGDGIGPEVTGAVVTILEAAGLQANWDAHDAGVLALERHGEPLPQALLDSVRRTKVALKGPVTTPVGGGFTSVNVGLRKALNLFANLRPVWNIAGVPSRYTGVDLVIVRENTEDLYAGLEHEVVPGVVESLKIITAEASTRIARFAFEHARRHGRRRVTAVHKANIMKHGEGQHRRDKRERPQPARSFVTPGWVRGLGIPLNGARREVTGERRANGQHAHEQQICEIAAEAE